MSTELALIQRGIATRPDFRGARAPGGLVFDCACGCGGHALVDRENMEKLEAYRAARQASAKIVFSGNVYIREHAPAGIVGEAIRTGERTHLRATS